MIPLAINDDSLELAWARSDGLDLARRKDVAVRSYARSGWVSSLALHAVAGLIVLAFTLFLAAQPQTSGLRQIEMVVAQQRAVEPPLLVLPWQESALPRAADLADSEIQRLSATTIPPELQAELLDESLPLDALSPGGHWVAARVLDEIARAEQSSPQDRLARLRSLTNQLNRVASEDSVSAVTDRLAAALGAEVRTTAPPAEPVPGEFDFETAQVHDVWRSEPTPGRYEYVAILLDSQGRMLETPLSAAEGQQLFQIMELVKANPLLERIYRGVAMSLLDKLLKPAASEPSPQP